MSHGMVSGSQVTLHYCKIFDLPDTKSLLEPCLHLSFSTYLLKPIFSLKTQSGSFRKRTKATINNLYATTESFYDLLGISESGTLSEIKQAYKQLARKYHPDVSPPNHTEEYASKFIQVQEAYETLSDPKSRALYDGDMARGLHMAFGARKRFQHNEGLDERGERKNQWQTQLTELKRKSMNKDSRENMSWGARMRRQRSN